MTTQTLCSNALCCAAAVFLTTLLASPAHAIPRDRLAEGELEATTMLPQSEDGLLKGELGSRNASALLDELITGDDIEPLLDRPSPRGHYIVQGEITVEFPATAALMGEGEAFCTGTLIAERTVLTAAHCLEYGAPDSVYFGPEPGVGGESVAVSDVVIHEDYDFWNEEAASDIGLVILAEPAGIEPVTLDSADAYELVGQQIFYVGYGATEGTGGEGLKKAATAMVEEVSGDLLIVQPDSGSACWGDSGGPLYRVDDGGEMLVSGVVSFGYTDDCMDLGGNTRTDMYVDWILNNLEGSASGGGGSVASQDDTGDTGDTGWDSGSWDTGSWDTGELGGWGCSMAPGGLAGGLVFTLPLLLLGIRRRA